MLSILCPTRNRPAELTRMVRSVCDTTSGLGAVEILFYVDDDDQLSVPAIEKLQLTESVSVGYKIGKRMTLTQCWNELLPQAKGELFMQGNDDIIFRTGGWDQVVKYVFDTSADKIWFVHGSDEGMHFQNFGAHGVVHQRWIDVIGYFIPPYFVSDYGDKWLNDVADGLGRRKYVPIVIEHMHFMFSKAEKDSTTIERLQRHQRLNPDATWNKTAAERQGDINKLREITQPGYVAKPVKSCQNCGSLCIVEFSNIRRCNQCGSQSRLR